MPAAIAVPLITAAASGTAAIVGAKMQSGASNKAATLQSDANTKALDYTKTKDAQDRADALQAQLANYGQFVAKEKRMTPYRAAGQGATEKMAHLLGLPQVDIPPPAAPPAYLTQAATPAPSAAAPASGLVTVRAPNGQTKQVPQADVPYWTSKGATQVVQ